MGRGVLLSVHITSFVWICRRAGEGRGTGGAVYSTRLLLALGQMAWPVINNLFLLKSGMEIVAIFVRKVEF